MRNNSNTRSRVEIIADVLELCQTPQKQYSIILGAKLSSSAVIDYLKRLVESGLLEKSVGMGVLDDTHALYYQTTTNGREFLKTAKIVRDECARLFDTRGIAN